ncbi:hypothetical protein WJX79_004605 [Trebouxia sp. C0005]
MDEVFSKVRVAIEQHSGLLKREAAVRLKVWLAKLSEQTNNPVWKKNRNAYSKLLLNQLKQGCLEKPFNAAPPAGPLQTLPASLTYSFSLPRTSSAKSTIRSGVSVSSSQGNPASNAAEEPQLDDYLGRHASPRRTASGGTALSQGEQFTDAQELDSAQLSHQKSGLWGVESNPSRQPSVSVRADSPPRRQKSGTLELRSSPGRQRSGILRTGSSGSSLRGHESHSLHAHKVPSRAPSRLRDSSTDVEVQYAAEFRHQLPSRREGSSTEEEHRGLHTSRQHKATEPPHSQYRTAEKYMSRAKVQEALSPQRRHSPTQHHAAKARILDLHNNCTLAAEEQDQLSGDRHHHARDSGQGGAQVQLGGTTLGLSRGLPGGRRGDGIDLADESWQPSKLELQARLGASKERQLELEWRLQQAEQKIAQAQARHVAQQLSGSEQSQQPSASDQSDPRKHRLKRDLSKLIHKYEKRQSRWGSPTRAASIQHLLPLDCGIGSSEEEDFDGLADITAALKSCSQREPLDLGSGDHPLSKQAQTPALQPNALPPQHRSRNGNEWLPEH